MLLRIIENILLHDPGAFPIGTQRIDPFVVFVDHLWDPDFYGSGSCPVIGKQSDTVCDYLADSVNAR